MLKWLDENLEEFLMVALLIAMTVIMGIQVFARYALGASLSWSEELTRYLLSGQALSVLVIVLRNVFPLKSNSL